MRDVLESPQVRTGNPLLTDGLPGQLGTVGEGLVLVVALSPADLEGNCWEGDWVLVEEGS